MATNPSIKKSSIPRATHDCDRTDQAKSRLKGPRLPVPKPPAYPQHSRPAPNDGLLKEDQDAVRRSLLELETDHAKMRQTLEDTVREAEERLAAMEALMAERDKLYSDNLDAATERTETLENQVEDYEKKLIENNIDPVTGEAQELKEDQTAAVEKVKKVTKGDVTKMREKLHQLNENSDKYLIDVQNILRDIEELEGTSQRVSNSAQFEGLSNKDLQALIGEVEEAQKKEEEQKKKEKKKKKEEEGGVEEEEEEGDTEEEEEEEEPSPRQDEVPEGLQPPTKADVFITEKKENTGLK